jgi:uncharacterized membrane protein YgdD (TMEM256/DUF423 family)
MSTWLALAALSGFLSVAIGAFGAHGLEARVSEQAMEWLGTGLRYQMLHVGGLLAVGLLATRAWAASLGVAGIGFALGTLLFSGLLYAMALGGPRWLGMVVPLGGLSFLIGWAALAWYALRGVREEGDQP